jgi:hypothetical protein
MEIQADEINTPVRLPLNPGVQYNPPGQKLVTKN